MPATNTDQPIRLLHLSDLHFKAGTAWDADPLLRALAGFIEKEVADGLVPDLVAITGDLAHAGVGEEYTLARDWLENQLWPAMGNLPRDRLLLVPGNHDVDRKEVDFVAEAVQGRLLQKGLDLSRSQAQIAEVLDKPAQREVVLKRHAAYLAFVEGWFGGRQALPWWEKVIETRGTRLHFAGLDSAWMACGDDDRGRLLLGRYQLTQTVETVEAMQADWRLALVHHPWAYLAEFDENASRQSIHQHCELLLRGHLHFPQTERIVPPDPSRSCLELAAGCVYENGYGYPNAFQWIELSPTNRRVRVLYRIWEKNAWTIDRNQPGCPGGYAEFDLGAPAQVARGPSHPAAPSIPPAYLEWLQRNYADVSLLGQEVQKGQAITLSQVYVPALTRPGAGDSIQPEWLSRQLDRTFEQERVTLLERLNMESLYVPAPAGAGKSTFCRWAVLQSIAIAPTGHPVPAPDEFGEPEPKSLRGRLPLLVPLRDFSIGMDCGRGGRTWHRGDLERALAAWVDASPPPGLLGDLVKAHIKAGSAFLLLDGLDEVPVSDTREGHAVFPRELLLSGLADALPEWLQAGNRILLTSRPYGLDEAGLHRLRLPQAPLEPLPRKLQDLFVARWFHTLGRPEKTEDLIATIRQREDLAPLVENPMLLTALCVLHESGGRLPEDRYELYKRIVNNVLFHRFHDEVRQREPARARLEAIALGMHLGDAESPRQSPAAEISNLEVEQLLRAFAKEDSSYERGRVEPVAQRDELLTRSGLLLPRENDRAAFYHLSVQEYLAAERILRLEDDLWPIFRDLSAVAEWRATLLFLFAGKIAGKSPRWGSDLLQRLLNEQVRPAVEANPWPVVFIAEALELCLAKDYSVPEILKEGFRRLALDAIVDEVALHARQALGLCLGRLGDPRIFDLRDARAYVEVPAGTYPYGEDNEAVEIKAPFLLGRYPVTNSQYRAFMDDDGYAKREYWSDAGWAWRQKEGATEPSSWRDRRWNGPNQPVVGVSFWEAEACCRWAGGRLPKEGEWEAAARGPEGFLYPWGNAWEDGICNSQEAGLGVTSAVGLFPRARQATLGIEDLAGNVWEWCENVNGAERLLRGGSVAGTSWELRACAQGRNKPEVRNGYCSFRCVLASPRQP